MSDFLFPDRNAAHAAMMREVGIVLRAFRRAGHPLPPPAAFVATVHRLWKKYEPLAPS